MSAPGTGQGQDVVGRAASDLLRVYRANPQIRAWLNGQGSLSPAQQAQVNAFLAPYGVTAAQVQPYAQSTFGGGDQHTGLLESQFGALGSGLRRVQGALPGAARAVGDFWQYGGQGAPPRPMPPGQGYADEPVPQSNWRPPQAQRDYQGANEDWMAQFGAAATPGAGVTTPGGPATPGAGGASQDPAQRAYQAANEAAMAGFRPPAPGGGGSPGGAGGPLPGGSMPVPTPNKAMPMPDLSNTDPQWNTAIGTMAYAQPDMLTDEALRQLGYDPLRLGTFGEALRQQLDPIIKAQAGFAGYDPATHSAGGPAGAVDYAKLQPWAGDIAKMYMTPGLDANAQVRAQAGGLAGNPDVLANLGQLNDPDAQAYTSNLALLQSAGSGGLAQSANQQRLREFLGLRDLLARQGYGGTMMDYLNQQPADNTYRQQLAMLTGIGR